MSEDEPTKPSSNFILTGISEDFDSLPPEPLPPLESSFSVGFYLRPFAGDVADAAGRMTHIIDAQRQWMQNMMYAYGTQQITVPPPTWLERQKTKANRLRERIALWICPWMGDD